jgi:hypothetical protein
MKKDYSSLQFYFPTNHRIYLFHDDAPNVSEEEGPLALYSKSLQASRKYCKQPLCRFWNHDQVANYLQAELQKLD